MAEAHSESAPAPSDDTAAKPPPDPRTVKVRDEFVRLLGSAESIWRDAFRSQVQLASSLDELATTITEIKQFTQLPNYPAGIRRLQACQARVVAAKKRIGAIGPRLSRLALVAQQQATARRQQEQLREQAALQAAPVPVPSEAAAETVPEADTTE